MISKLESLEKEKPKEYWKIVNELREKRHKQTSFNADSFTKFFEELFAKVETTETEKDMEKFITEHLVKYKPPVNQILLWRNLPLPSNG